VIFFFLLLLKPALRAAEGGSKNPLDWIALIIAFPLDVLIAHTTWAIFAGFPKKNEWTISHALERLIHEKNENQLFYQELSKYINRISPNHNHIKGLK
jgi:hypothetical protein